MKITETPMTREEQEQPEATRGRIPTFKTIEEEAAFWDTHSSEEFADELTPTENVKFIKARPKRPPPHTHPTSAKPQ